MRGVFQEFREFLLRGSVVDLAIGVVVGAAFGAVVNALVKDILTPFIAASIHAPDFSGLLFMLNGSAIHYGNFLNALISFLLVSTAIFFFIIKPMNLLIARTKKEGVATATKICPECLSEIPAHARRCAHCTQAVG